MEVIGQIVKSRKKELSDTEMSRQIIKYVRFFKTKKNVLILDTNMSKKKLINKALKKVKVLLK